VGLQWGRRGRVCRGKKSRNEQRVWSLSGSLVNLEADVARTADDQKLGGSPEATVDFGSIAEIKYLVLLSTYGWKPIKL